jgi:hypothetical protein
VPACRSRGKREAMPNPVSRTSPSAQFTTIWAGLTSLWTRVRLAQRRDNPDREVQEASRLHRSLDESRERFASGVLEQQRCPTAVAGKRERPSSPCGVEIAAQLIFVGESVEDSRRRALHRRQHCQHRTSHALAICPPSTAEDPFTILSQDLEVADPIRVVLKRRIQLPDSDLGRVAV